MFRLSSPFQRLRKKALSLSTFSLLPAVVIIGLTVLTAGCQTTTAPAPHSNGILELSDIPDFNPALTPPEVHGKPVSIVAMRDAFFKANPTEEYFPLVVKKDVGGGAFFRKDGSVNWHYQRDIDGKNYETKVIYSSSHMTCIAPIHQARYFSGYCFYLRQMTDNSNEVWFTSAPMPQPGTRQYIKTHHRTGVTLPE